MNRYYHIVKDMFHGFDYQPFIDTDNPAERLKHLTKAVGHILKGRDAKRNRFIDQTTALGQAYALANPHEDAVAIRNEVAFFQVVKATLIKSQITTYQPKDRKTPQAVEAAVADIVNRAVAPDGVIDLLEVVELDQQKMALLSEEFLFEVQALEDKDLAAELLRRLIEDRIKARRRSNLVKSRHFSDMLNDAVKRYNDQVISAKEIIEAYLDIAHEIRDSDNKMEELGLSADEIAFYEALAINDSAVQVMGDDLLKEIAQLLVKQVRNNVSIDWELREAARAEMRVLVKRILRRYGYPPDKQKMAVDLIVQQATEFSKDWAVERPI